MSLSETVLPIVQPLAPCLAVGCCAVNRAVPRALLMVIPLYQLFFNNATEVEEARSNSANNVI